MVQICIWIYPNYRFLFNIGNETKANAHWKTNEVQRNNSNEIIQRAEKVTRGNFLLNRRTLLRAQRPVTPEMKPRNETGASADKMQMRIYEQLETTAVTLLGKMAEKQVRKRGPQHNLKTQNRRFPLSWAVIEESMSLIPSLVASIGGKLSPILSQLLVQTEGRKRKSLIIVEFLLIPDSYPLTLMFIQQSPSSSCYLSPSGMALSLVHPYSAHTPPLTHIIIS